MLEEALSPRQSTTNLVLLSRFELEQVTGAAVVEPCDAIAAVARLLGEGASTVLVSLDAGSAVLVEDGGAYHAESIDAALGAASAQTGDALLAGFQAAGGRGPRALQEGVAWAAAAAQGRETPDSLAFGEGRDDVVLTWIDALELIRER